MTGNRDDVQDQVDVDEYEALEQIARERWGDQWTIRVNHYADGTTRRYAMHSDGRLRPDEHNFDDDARVLEQERIWVNVDEQQIYRDRVHIRKEFEIISSGCADAHPEV
ncbi:hypothetical protein [Natrinema gelatinilyticum]|uniref:hypothetical protein n=1 Tax=Natrinema gelatinilyticum TaxID=2961571 RepID=UPI0020C47203|nr:hypothetical protein [Natrinema gelatinilyticum]